MPDRKTKKCRRCPAFIYKDGITGLCAECLAKDRAAKKPDEMLKTDRELARLREELSRSGKLLKASEADVKRLNKELHYSNEIASLDITPAVIEPREPSGTAEGVVAMNCSDWHCEERVDPATISFVNTFNLDVCKERVGKLFRSGLRLTRLLQQDIKVHTMVLGLLGDFITNDIHDEMPEICQLRPTEAIEFAQDLLVGGIEHILDNSDLKLIVPCHSGNHARTTKQVRFSTENGHSLEYLMYRNLERYFGLKYGAERIEFRVSKGYHSMVDIYGTKVRYHHGHAINYAGGIGGIFIPAFKAISQWNKITKGVDLDFFGHFHQHKDGGNFVSNGSLIGFNTYALSIKADYEPPNQTLTLFDKKRGRTCTWPILFTK
jgi:hypothetical protein